MKSRGSVCPCFISAWCSEAKQLLDGALVEELESSSLRIIRNAFVISDWQEVRSSGCYPNKDPSRGSFGRVWTALVTPAFILIGHHCHEAIAWALVRQRVTLVGQVQKQSRILKGGDGLRRRVVGGG